MTSASELFQRVLSLSAFDGDSREAMLALHRYFASDYPDCSLALLLVRNQPAGRCRLAGLIGPDGTEHVPNVDSNGEHSALPMFDDALAQNMIASEAPHVVAVPASMRGTPLAQVLFTPASVLAIPIANRGVNTHWVAFGSTVAHRFDNAQLDHVLLHVNLATSLIVRPIALRQVTAESERRRLQIESLADIQRLLLPDNPQITGLDYAVYWQPAETAAGDYYEITRLTEFAPPDFTPTGDDIFGVIIGDVSGHGAAAAMEAVQFDAILRTYQGGDGPPPAAAISYVNKYFFSRRNRGHFVTLFAVIYRPDTRVLSYLSAGHPPLMRRRRGDVEMLGESDQIPLGVLRDYEYRNNEVALERDDVLVMYTDGIVEARDADENMFGADRLKSLIADGPESPRALMEHIVSAVREHQNAPLGHDDQTLIILKIEH